MPGIQEGVLAPRSGVDAADGCRDGGVITDGYASPRADSEFGGKRLRNEDLARGGRIPALSQRQRAQQAVAVGEGSDARPAAEGDLRVSGHLLQREVRDAERSEPGSDELGGFRP